MPTCGGIGTYLPNYHTMQVSGQGKTTVTAPVYYRVFRHSGNSDIVHESDNQLNRIYSTGIRTRIVFIIPSPYDMVQNYIKYIIFVKLYDPEMIPPKLKPWIKNHLKRVNFQNFLNTRHPNGR